MNQDVKILDRAEFMAWYQAQSVEMRALIDCLASRLINREGFPAPVAANAIYNLVIHAAEDYAADMLLSPGSDSIN